MSQLSALELELLSAAAAAHEVKRPPDYKLAVGDAIIVVRQRVRKLETVLKVGTAWITVSGERSKFRVDTWKSSTNYGTGCFLKTPEQEEYDTRIGNAREQLREAGIAFSSVVPMPDGQILALAALVKLLKDNINRTARGELTCPN